MPVALFCLVLLSIFSQILDIQFLSVGDILTFHYALGTCG